MKILKLANVIKLSSQRKGRIDTAEERIQWRRRQLKRKLPIRKPGDKKKWRN